MLKVFEPDEPLRFGSEDLMMAMSPLRLGRWRRFIIWLVALWITFLGLKRWFRKG